MGHALHYIGVREVQGHSVTLDVPEALDRLGLTKVGFDALMESNGWFCSTRDGSSDTYYNLGPDPYQYMDIQAPTRNAALAQRLQDLYGTVQPS